jgi:hypothetical protein
MHKLIPPFLVVLGLILLGLGILTLSKVWILGLFFAAEGLFFGLRAKRKSE